MHTSLIVQVFLPGEKTKVRLQCYLTMTVSLNLPHSYNISRIIIDIVKEIFQISTRYEIIIDLKLNMNSTN